MECITVPESGWEKNIGALLGVDIPYGGVAGYVVERLEGGR